MASLDFKFLFTNIPLNETIIALVICAIKIFMMWNSAKETLLENFKLLETATRESSFIFHYLLYKQVDRVMPLWKRMVG